MTPYSKIEDACWKALRLGFEFTKEFTLVIKDGHYVPANNDKPTCHVLEAVLLGERCSFVPSIVHDGRTIEDADDLERLLGVNSDWLSNFMEAYQGTSTDAYEAAKKIFAKYPPKTE